MVIGTAYTHWLGGTVVGRRTRDRKVAGVRRGAFTCVG